MSVPSLPRGCTGIAEARPVDVHRPTLANCIRCMHCMRDAADALLIDLVLHKIVPAQFIDKCAVDAEIFYGMWVLKLLRMSVPSLPRGDTHIAEARPIDVHGPTLANGIRWMQAYVVFCPGSSKLGSSAAVLWMSLFVANESRTPALVVAPV
mmetsp:Transcript_113286/g.360076  ORF Transcript_113286/g.360076 Transcript_113286/m.360076 type:complete len:152 (-) Transcript_113286:225-680(-)